MKPEWRKIETLLQVRFSQKGSKSLTKFTPKNTTGLVRTLWMSEITPRKAPVLKPYVLQIFGCEFGE